MRTLTIGIDPGKSGGWCEIWPCGTAVTHKYESMSCCLESFQDICQSDDYDKVYACIEKVGGYIAGNSSPGSAMFNFGENYGFWQGLLMGLAIPLYIVTPQKWQSGLNGLTKKTGAERKRALKDCAAQMYPKCKVTLKTCDALLIAHWAKMNLTEVVQ